MASTAVLEEKKSKRACPACNEKRLYTNDVEKFDDSMLHLCQNCGYEFTDNEQIRKYRDDTQKDEKESPWSVGFLVLLAMVATILTIQLVQPNNAGTPAGSPQPTQNLPSL